jgi:hypothetical protein
MSDLQFIMERTAGKLVLWACRGAGRGCPRNRFRTRKRHCDDCVACDNPNETVEQVQERLRRGDA